MTPYTMLQNLERALLANRQIVKDPGSAGTVVVFPNGAGVLNMATAGTRTLQSATQLGLGTSLLAVSSVASVVVSYSSTTINLEAGEYAEFIVVLNSANVQVWGLRRSSNNAAATMSVQLPITTWRADAALQTLLATATTSSTLFQILNGTYGTSAANLQAKAATAADTVTIAARNQVQLPVNYRAGTDITLTTTVTRTTAATTSGTLLFAAYRDAGPTVNLVADAATDINAAASISYSCTITGTNLAPGNEIDLRAIVATSGASTTAGEWHLSPVTLTYTKA